MAFVHPATVRGEFPLQLLELAMLDKNQIIQVGASSSASNAKARNVGIKMFLNSPCEWLLWIDEDCATHPNAPSKLRAFAMEHDAKVAAGFVAVYDPISAELGLGGWNYNKETGIWENADSEDEAFWVDGVGCHFSLWHRSIYEDILEPPYHIDWAEHPDTGGPMGHDLAFCLRLNKKGIRPLFVPEVLTWHVKEWKIGKNEWDNYNAAHTSV